MRDYERWQQTEDGSWTRRLSANANAEQGVKATAGAVEAAEAAGIDLATIQGSGRDGQITKADVEAAAA